MQSKELLNASNIKTSKNRVKQLCFPVFGSFFSMGSPFDQYEKRVRDKYCDGNSGGNLQCHDQLLNGLRPVVAENLIDRPVEIGARNQGNDTWNQKNRYRTL